MLAVDSFDLLRVSSGGVLELGLMGVLGPDYVADALGLEARDFWLIVLPIGLGVVTGILALNSWGKAVSGRRLIEGGLLGVGAGLALLALAQPISAAISDGASSIGGLPIGPGHQLSPP